MEISKAETPEDEREISLNETSLKRPLDVVDVVGGHGPWQFRQWIVFFAATLCNATVLFSALFLPSQTYCFPSGTANASGSSPSPLVEVNGSSLFPGTASYAKGNGSVHSESGCSGNSTDCSTGASEKLLFEAECWNSEIEVFVKCSYVVACLLSGLVVYFSTERFGRRPLALVSCVFLVASSLGTSWAGTAAVFLILRFITSLGVVSVYFVSAFTLMEYVHEDFKLLYFFTGHLGWGVAHFFLPAVAWMAEDWVSFNVILSVSCALLSVCVWWGPESPSSFPNGGELTRTRKALKYAAFINGYSTTDVDLLSHNFRLGQETKHDLGTLASVNTKIFCCVYSSFLFVISFTTAFLYFCTKWHPEWLKVDSRRVSFSFLGTTEVASAIILLFLTCLIPIKHLLASVCVMSSCLLIVIFSRTQDAGSRSSVLLYIVTVFFASAAWTLVLAKCFCHKMSGTIAKFSLVVTAVATFSGAFLASAIVLKADNQHLLLTLAIPHLIFGTSAIFLPDYYFGTVS